MTFKIYNVTFWKMTFILLLLENTVKNYSITSPPTYVQICEKVFSTHFTYQGIKC